MIPLFFVQRGHHAKHLIPEMGSLHKVELAGSLLHLPAGGVNGLAKLFGRHQFQRGLSHLVHRKLRLHIGTRLSCLLPCEQVIHGAVLAYLLRYDVMTFVVEQLFVPPVVGFLDGLGH